MTTKQVNSIVKHMQQAQVTQWKLNRAFVDTIILKELYTTWGAAFMTQDDYYAIQTLQTEMAQSFYMDSLEKPRYKFSEETAREIEETILKHTMHTRLNEFTGELRYLKYEEFKNPETTECTRMLWEVYNAVLISETLSGVLDFDCDTEIPQLTSLAVLYLMTLCLRFPNQQDLAKLTCNDPESTYSHIKRVL